MKYKITLKKFVLYTLRLFRHKFWAFYFCCKAGIPLRGLLHDLSKFLPDEFWEGVKYYTPHRSSYEICQEVTGSSKAYVKHINRNSHHSEHWMYLNKDGTPNAPCMSYKDTVEMLCNFLAAGRSYNSHGFNYEREYQWWQNQELKRYYMNEAQCMFLDICFSSLAYNNKLNIKKMKTLYNTTKYMSTQFSSHRRKSRVAIIPDNKEIN